MNSSSRTLVMQNAKRRKTDKTNTRSESRNMVLSYRNFYSARCRCVGIERTHRVYPHSSRPCGRLPECNRRRNNTIPARNSFSRDCCSSGSRGSWTGRHHRPCLATSLDNLSYVCHTSNSDCCMQGNLFSRCGLIWLMKKNICLHNE